MRRLWAAIVIPLAACSGGTESAPADPVALLGRAQATMAGVETASFEMTRGGAPATIEGFEFTSAVGRYEAPASAEAVLQV
ncbi:MAG TPA: hypothetical protein VLS92_07425, partial [Acidimicrobiia bacterium]|nr:hypothetical protein [Acidimicrobiia bacterium]